MCPSPPGRAFRSPDKRICSGDGAIPVPACWDFRCRSTHSPRTPRRPQSQALFAGGHERCRRGALSPQLESEKNGTQDESLIFLSSRLQKYNYGESRVACCSTSRCSFKSLILMELQQEPRATINHWKINSSSQRVTRSPEPLRDRRASCLPPKTPGCAQKWITDLQQGLSHRL